MTRASAILFSRVLPLGCIGSLDTVWLYTAERLVVGFGIPTVTTPYPPTPFRVGLQLVNPSAVGPEDQGSHIEPGMIEPSAEVLSHKRDTT